MFPPNNQNFLPFVNFLTVKLMETIWWNFEVEFYIQDVASLTASFNIPNKVKNFLLYIVLILFFWVIFISILT